MEAVKTYNRLAVSVVVDNLRSLYNIGSIFRTADAVLIDKIYLCGISGAPPNKEIEKVALGAVHTVPFEYCKNTVEIIEKLKKEGRTIVAVELTNNSINYKNYQWKTPLALVLGNEVDGVGDKVIENCDAAVDIPMKGRANSLNVATAFAVVAYEIYSRVND